MDRSAIRQASRGRLVGSENVVKVDLCHGLLVSLTDVWDENIKERPRSFRSYPSTQLEKVQLDPHLRG